MKKIIVMSMLLVLNFTLLYAKNTCTPEQINEMIQHDFSQKTIKFTCKNYKYDESSQLKPPPPANNNTKKAQEYLFFKAGYGTFSISDSDFSEDSLNIGLQYFFNSLTNSGLGVGYNSSYATSDKQTLTTTELELLFSIASQDANTITSSIIIGKLYESLDNSHNKSTTINGYGVYINYASIVNKGQGISLYFKNLYTKENKAIKLFGLAFTW